MANYIVAKSTGLSKHYELYNIRKDTKKLWRN